MATKNVSGRIQLKHDTAQNWQIKNTVLLAGEIGLETDTKKAKIGDGTTTWNSLSYAWGGVVPAITTGTTNGTISVGGTDVSVKGLKSGAFNDKYTHPASGATAGSYGPSANASPDHGGAFSVPYVTVDANGHITAASTKTITLPTDNNTDTKVTNTLGTTTKYYVTGTTSNVTNTGTQVFDTGVYVSETAGELVAIKFTGNLTGNVTGNCSGSAGSVDWANVSDKPTAVEITKTGFTDNCYSTEVTEKVSVEINKLGGKTVVWNQLETFSATSREINDITWTLNADGTINASGTASADSYVETPVGRIPDGNKILIKGCPSGGSSSTYCLYDSYRSIATSGDVGSGKIYNSNGDLSTIRCYIASGQSVNITFIPQVFDLTLMFGAGNEPTTVAEFEAMFPADYYTYNAGTLLSVGVTSVVSKGENLLPTTYVQLDDLSGTLTYIINADNSITFNGTPTSLFTMDGVGSTWKWDGITPCWLSGCPTGGNSSSGYSLRVDGYGTGNYSKYDVGNGIALEAKSGYLINKSLKFKIVIRANTVCNNITFKPMLNYGSSAKPYAPYMNIAYSIPAEIQALTGYGWSAGTAYNYIDFKRKVFVQNVGSVDLGSLEWNYLTDGGTGTERFSTQIADILKSSNFTAHTGATVNLKYIPEFTSSSTDYNSMLVALKSKDKIIFQYTSINGTPYIQIKDTNYTDSATFTTAMDGIYLNYELQTPVETDISTYLTDDVIIEVDESSGTLTFPNQNGDSYRIPIFIDVAYIDYTLGLMTSRDKLRLDNSLTLGSTLDATKLSGTIPAECYTDTQYIHPNTVTAGTVGTSSATSGITLAVPYVTYNANGHITATGTHTHTVPNFTKSGSTAAAGLVPAPSTTAGTTKYLREDGTWAVPTDTDTKVTNTLGTTTKFYVTGTTSATTNTGGQTFDTGVYVSTTAGELVANQFTGSLNGNANTASKIYTSEKIGDTNKPVYIAADGTVTPIGYAVNKDVPSNAVFTDTKDWASITGKPIFATVATSGSYNDLNNKPTIPTITDTYSGTSSNGMSGKAVKSAIDAALVSAYKPSGSITFASLPTLSASVMGNVYNITDAFTITSNFIEYDANKTQTFPAGTEVAVINTGTTSSPTYKFSVMSGFIDLSGYQPTSTAVTHTASTKVGDTNKPVYIAADGKATAISYAVNKDVPSTAVFTDTKNTAGSTDISTKIFLIGASSQAANPQTYSDDQVYATNGTLTAATFSGSGASLTSLNASNISSGTLTAARLATSGATAGSYGESADKSPGYGGSFNIPYITVDTYGRVTEIANKAITIPNTDNTDTKNTAGSTNSTSKLFLIGATSQATNPQTYSSSKVYETDGVLTATSFAGNLTGNVTGNVTGNLTGTASKATGDADGNAIKTTYAKLASPALTGTPTAPTAAAGTNTTQIATTAFVNTAIGNKTYNRDDLVSLASKTYTGLYATADNFASGTYYFAKVVPTDYYTPYKVTYRLHVYVPDQSNYNGYYTISVGGVQSSLICYDAENNFYSTSYRPVYNHVIYRAKSVGVATYGHLLGERITSATNATSTSYKRTIVVEILTTENCAVSLFDSALLYADVPGTGSTNYDSYSEMTGTSVGLFHTGDQNTYERIYMNGYRAVAGANGIKQYSLVMEDGDGNFQSFTTTNGTGTSKTKNIAGFKLGKVFYASTSSNYTSGQSAGNGVLYEAYPQLDFRYSTNCGTTLTEHKPIYIKGTVGSDGLFYLADTWYTQTLPSSDDGCLYIEVGRTYSTYTVTMPINKPIWWYKDGAIRQYTHLQNHTHSYAGSSSAGGAATSANKLNTNAGSATQPVYFSNGVPAATTYSIGASVPSGAVFTDTKNTAGSTDTSSKIFLVGATSQAANPQTYSDNEIYATSGVLTTKSVQIGGMACTIQYNDTNQCIDFVFAS